MTGTAEGYGLDCRGVDSRQGQEISFFLSTAQSFIQRVPEALSLGIKQQERETDHSPLFSAEVKNGGAIPPSPYDFMSYCLINLAQGKF
jgi:hypothetical protein